jgi:hypothetical protein
MLNLGDGSFVAHELGHHLGLYHTWTFAVATRSFDVTSRREDRVAGLRVGQAEASAVTILG